MRNIRKSKKNKKIKSALSANEGCLPTRLVGSYAVNDEEAVEDTVPFQGTPNEIYPVQGGKGRMCVCVCVLFGSLFSSRM